MRSDPAGPDFLALRAFTSELLKRVFPDIDIVVVGNEPFIESNPQTGADSSTSTNTWRTTSSLMSAIPDATFLGAGKQIISTEFSLKDSRNLCLAPDAA